MVKKHFFYIFLQLFSPIVLLLLIGILFYGNSEIENKMSLLQGREILNVNLGAGALTNKLKSVSQDVRFLSNHSTLQLAINKPTAPNISHLIQDFVNFSKSKGIYDQIRWVDDKGMERARVDFRSDTPVIVSGSALQNKVSRYYFTKVSALNQGEIFASPLDLNVEYGKVEEPYKPTIRVGTPVFDTRGNKAGIILLNYYGADLLQDFITAAANIRDHISLVNNAGYWLKSPNAEQEWGFMFNRTEMTIDNEYPRVWRSILRQESGQQVVSGGLWTWGSVYPLKNSYETTDDDDTLTSGSVGPEIASDKYVWKVIAHLSSETLAAVEWAIWQRLIIVSIFILVITGFSSWKITLAWKAQAEAEEYVTRINTDLEKQVTVRTNELKNKVLELDDALDELERRNKDMESMVYIASHDLRSPLINIQGFSQRLASAIKSIDERFMENDVPQTVKDSLNNVLNKQIPIALEFIKSSSLQMDRLINGLLMLSRSGRVELNIKVLDINEMLTQINTNLSIQLQNVSGKIITDDLHPCLGDPVQLNQIFTNIIDNAIKYHEPSRPLDVHVRSWCDKGRVFYEISDNGIGIRQKQQSKVWQLFYRIDPNGSVNGEGVGLTLVNRMMDRLGGSIKLESVWGEGSRFIIELPAGKKTK